ncbi:MAG TPA: hypothetical protein VK749_15915 [Xanthobacteraceae bacterium]|nr:hypothetical protein [Xanthobacteraceae bacterium]
MREGAYGNQIAQAKEREGQELGSSIHSAGEAANNTIEHMEISKAGAHGAELVATLNESWNQTAKNADPNDPAVAAKWRAEVMEPALEKFEGGFLTDGGRQFAQREIDEYRNHAVVKTSADMSSLAGDAVHINAEKTINGLSTAAFNDPSTVDFARDMLGRTLDGLTGTSPNISASDAAKVKTELTLKGEESIVKSAVMGAIVKGGDWQSIANDPKNKPYINAVEIQQFAHAEKFYQHADESEARSARQDRDYQNRTDFNAKMNVLEADTMPQNVGDPPRLPADYWQRLRDAAAHPGAALEPGRLRTMAQNGDAITARLGKPEPLSGISHATTMDLLTQMRATDATRMADTGPIYKAYEDGKLNNQDFKFLQDQFSTMRSPEGERLDKARDRFFNLYKLSIDPYAGADTDKTGRQPIYEAEMAARQREEAVRAAGGDPHSVYDVTSPNFFGKPENLQQFRDHAPLSSLFRQPGAPGGDLTAPPPDRPKNFPANAQWDANARYWYVIQNGKKFRVDPTTAR